MKEETMSYEQAIEVAKSALRLTAHHSRKSATHNVEARSQFPHTPVEVLEAIAEVTAAYVRAAEEAEAALAVLEEARP